MWLVYTLHNLVISLVNQFCIKYLALFGYMHFKANRLQLRSWLLQTLHFCGREIAARLHQSVLCFHSQSIFNYNSCNVLSKVSRRMSAWWGWKMRAGRKRSEFVPQVPSKTPAISIEKNKSRQNYKHDQDMRNEQMDITWKTNESTVNWRSSG